MAKPASFAETRAACADAPLTEIAPAAPGDDAAAFGFALGWISMAAPDGLLFWSAPETSFGEHGAPYAEGLAQFGVPLDRLLIMRTNTQAEALWAAEQALTIANACVICTIVPAPKPLSLTATRRLLLLAEKNKSRCVLLRLDRLGASAAWTRWAVAAAPSQGSARELGAPTLAVRLIRNRAGAAGGAWRLEWNAHERTFRSASPAEHIWRRTLAGARAAAPDDGPAGPVWRRAG